MAEFVFDDAPKSGFGMGDKKKGDFVFDSDTDQGDSSILRRTVGDLGVALAKGTLVGIPETVTGLLDIPTMGYAGKAAEAVGKGLGIGGFKEGREYFDEMLTPETKQAVKEVQETKGFFPTIGAALQRPSAIAQTVGESIPSMVAGGALTGMAAKGLGMGMTKIPVAMETAAQRAMKAGKLATLEDATALTAANAINKANIIKGATIGGVGEGIVTAGQNIEQTRQATPEGTLTPGQIAIQAASGILTGGISILSGRFAQYLNLADPQTMAAMIAYGGVPRTVAQKTKWTQDLSNVLKTMAREGFLEELPQSVQEAVAQNLALGKPVEEGIWEQGAMGLLSGMAQGGGAQVLSSAMDRMANDPIDQEINRGIEEIGGTEAQVVKDVGGDANAPLGETTVATAPSEVETAPDYSKVSVLDELKAKIADGSAKMNELVSAETTYPNSDIAAIARAEINRRNALIPPASQVMPEEKKPDIEALSYRNGQINRIRDSVDELKSYAEKNKLTQAAARKKLDNEFNSNIAIIQQNAKKEAAQDEVVFRNVKPAVPMKEHERRPDGIYGKQGRSWAGDDAIDYVWTLVNNGDLIVSHDANGVEDPNYKQMAPELQARVSRSNPEFVAETQRRSRVLEPGKLEASPSVGTGSPIVGDDLLVESGNGRAASIRLAYERARQGDAKAAQYKQYLMDNAANFGFTPEQVAAMPEPVLVRERVTKVDRNAFARVSNVGETQKRPPSEVAKEDAGKITDAMIDKLGIDAEGNVLAAGNSGFISDFLELVGPTEAADLVSGGKPTPVLVSRVKNALFAKAYQDDRLLTLMAEETDPNIQNIITALVTAAKTFVKLNTGKYAEDDLNNTKELTDAINIIRLAKDNDFKTTGTDLSQNAAWKYLSIPDMFGKSPSAEVRALAIELEFRRSKPAQLSKFINDLGEISLAEIIADQTVQMFGEKKTRGEVLNEAAGKEIVNEQELARSKVERAKAEGKAVEATNDREGKGEEPFKASVAGEPIPIQVISETKDGIMEISFKGEKPYPYRIPFAGDREKIKTLLRNRNYKAAEKKIDESMDKAFREEPLTAEQKKTGLEKVREAMGELKFSAAAYAGGPKLIGERLSTQHAGKGTGVHAQGFGLYFASQKKVGEYYKGLLENNPTEEELNYLFEDIRTDIDEGLSPTESITRNLDNYIQSERIPKAIDKKELLDAIKTIISDPESTASMRAYNRLRYLVAPYAPKAVLYKVELAPDEDEYLLWDEPFSKQSKKVQNALSSMYPRLFSEKQRNNWVESLKGKTGRQIYSRITNHEDNSMRRASARLREVGIRGNKYLDQGSRLLSTVNETVEPSYNYVIFADEDVEIKEIMASVTGTDKRILERMSPEDRKKAEDAVAEKMDAIDPADYTYVSAELKQQLDDEKTGTEVLHGRAVSEGRRWRVGVLSGVRERLERELRNFKRFISFFHPRGTHPELLAALSEERIAYRASLLLKLEKAKTQREREGIIEGAKTIAGSSKEVKAITERLSQIEDALYGNREKGIRGLRESSPEATEKKGIIKNVNDWTALIKERAKLRERKDTLIEQAEKDILKTPDVARLDARIEALDRDIAALDSKPKVFSIDEDAYKNKYARPAYALGASEGYEVVFIKDHYGFYNAFVNEGLKKIYVRVDAAHDALKLVRHEIAHIQKDETKKVMAMVDTESSAFQEYWKKWSKYSGVVGSMKAALEEYACDLRAGIEVNYGVNLKEGLLKTEQEYIGKLEDLIVRPKQVDVIAELPSYTEIPTADRANTHDNAVDLIKGHSKEPMSFSKAIGEMRTKFGRKFRLTELAELMGKRYVEVSYNAEKMTNKNAPAQYIKADNTIYLNPAVLMKLKRADDALETALSFNAVMAIAEQSETELSTRENRTGLKISYGDFQMKKDLSKFKESLNPYLKDAPENVKRIYNYHVFGKGAEIKSILGLAVYPDVAGWLDSLPAPGEGKGGNSLWQRLKDIILRAFGRVSKGRTKLDELAEIMDKYLQVSGKPLKDLPNKMFEEARKYPTSEAYIKAVSYVKTDMPAVKEDGLSLDIYKNRYGKTRTEPREEDLQTAAKMGYKYAEVTDLQAEITGIEQQLKEKQSEAKRSDLEEQLMKKRERLYSTILPIQTEHQRLRQIWAQAHGKKAFGKEGVGKFAIPERKRLEEEYDEMIEAPAGLTVNTFVNRRGLGFSLVERKEQAQGPVPTKAQSDPVEALDDHYKPMAKAWVQFLLRPKSKSRGTTILSEQDYINGIFKNISKRIVEEDTYDYITSVAEAFQEIKDAVLSSVEFYKANGGTPVMAALEAIQKDVQEETSAYQQRVDQLTELFKRFRGIEDLSILEELPEEPKLSLKKVEKVEKAEKKGTGEVIFYKGNTKIATMNMEVTGEDARISKLSGGSYLLNMFAKIFSDNPKVNTISMAVDQTTNKKERSAQLQTMASWKDLGAEENFVMGGDWVMTLDKTKFVKAITTPEEKKEIDIYTNQPKQPASVNAILDLWMRPEEILEKDQLPFGRRFTDVRKNKVAIPKIYDSYQEYLKRQTDRRLSPEEEHDAVLKAKYGDKKSIEDLVMTNQGFIHGIAKKLSKDPQEIMDLVQVGNTGFLDALQFFDPNRGFTYKTYAAIYVKSAIFKYLVENKTIRIPVGVFRGVNDEINAEIAKITGINTSGNIKPEVAAQQALDENKENLFKKVFPGKAYNIESLMPEELALLEGRFSRFYMDVYNALTQTQGQMKLDALAAVSMSKPTGEDTDIGDALADELTDTEEDKQGLKELLHKHLINAMGALSDVEQTAIYNRYIVGMTQEDVGIILNVTKNRVNQILRGIKGKSLGAHEKLLREVMRLEAAEAAQDNTREDFERNTHMSIADFFEPVNWVKVHLRKAGQAVEKNIKSQIDNNYVDHPHMMKKDDHNRFRNIITSHGGINYSKTREILSLPRQNAETSSDWRKLWDIFVKRIRERDMLSHAWLTKAKRFIHIQSTFKAAGLTKAQAKKEKHNIGRVLTIGDENLRNIRLALIKEVNKLTSEIKKGGRLFSSDLERRLAEAQAKLDRLNTEKRYSYDEAVKEGIEDWDGTKIRLTDLGYKLYSEVRATEDEIFNAYLGHSQNMLVRQYQKQKWYEALQFALGKQLSDKEILKIANKLQTTSSEKDIEKINRKGVYLKYDNIFAKVNAKFTAAQKEQAGKEIEWIYSNIQKDIAEELNDIKKMVQALGGGENIDEAVKEMFIAYQRVRPRLKRIRDVRNEWNEWPGFFPRERTAGTRKFKLYEQYVDSKGVAKEKEIFSQHFSSESEGLDIYSEVVDRYGKNGELPQKYRWDAEPIVKTEEGAFEGVKDFNVQAILDTAFENMRTEGGKFFDANGKEVDIKGKVWDTTFEAIAGQFQARGALAHGIHRKQKPGEKAIKGYLEVDHDQILKRHITSMAGLITKQEAAYSALEAMSELKDKTRAPELREYIKGQLRNDTNLDRISTKIRTFAFMFFLGGMFKSAAVNSTQPIIVGIPELDRYIRAKSIKGVSGTMAQLRASRLVALHPEIMTEDPEEWAHKTRQDGSANPKYKRFHPDDNMDKYLHEYLSNSLINGMMLAQHLRLIKGEMSGWGGAWNKAFDVLATPFSMVEKFNRITSGIAMFEVAINNYKKDPTLDWEAVYEKATYDANEFIDRVHYAIGKHNLPIPAQSGTALGVGLKTAYTFRPFTHNFLLNQFNMLRSAARLMGRPDAEARAQATNDLKTVLHTMFLMAIFGGMMGLPFFKDLSEFYEKHFGYSPKEWLRSALRGMGGQYLETVGMSGIPGLLGADMSGSLAIGVPFIGDQDSIDSVFGVYAGLGKKVKMAGQALSRGDYYRVTANLAPEFLRSPVVALTESDFGKEAFGFRGFATTTKGMPSYSSEGKILKYEGLEIPVKMLGFQPTRMKREREVEQAVKKQVLWATEEKSNISERFRIDRLQNDKDALKTMLKSVRELNIKLRERKIPVPLANVSSIIKNSRQTKNLQKRRELARRLQLETQ